MKQYTERDLDEKLLRGDEVVWLLDGECTGYRVDVSQPRYAFTVRVVSTGQEFAYERPFTTELRDGGLYIIWEISNGQLVGLPITREALEEAGSAWILE